MPSKNTSHSPPSQTLPHVVILGGGFGGMNAARALRKAPVRITLIDRRNHHLFQPLLYQVATAALSPADIAAPIRHILRHQQNTKVLMAEAADINTGGQRVILSDGREIAYDFLIIATGAMDHYFGHDEWSRAAPGLKRLEEAVEIRRRFLLAFEAAEQNSDPEHREALRTFVVVGAGPTGVEMAGAFAEVSKHTLLDDFREIDPRKARVVLIEGGSRVLSTYDEELSRKAQQQLERLGVEVRLNSPVTRIEPGAVHIGSEVIPTRNIVWAAGVGASPLGAKLGVPVDKMGRVVVEPDLSIPAHPEVFVIGDLSHFTDPESGRPLPGVAPVAMQMAKFVARNITSTLRGEPRSSFRYHDKGSMATIGRGAAIAQVGRIKLGGLLAWLTWIFIHLMYLVGFRNRVAVFMEWAWSYFTWQRGARLITGEVGPHLAPDKEVLGGISSSPSLSDQGKSGGWLEGDFAEGKSTVASQH